MTADVPQDRRVTVPTLGSNQTVFVDGSRLFWALLHPCMKDLGTGLRGPDRIQGDAVLSAFCRHGPVPVHVRSSLVRALVPTRASLAPCSPPSRSLRAAFGGGLRPTLTAAARDADQSAGRDEETATSRTKKLRRGSP